jgi:hypothetical protein
MAHGLSRNLINSALQRKRIARYARENLPSGVTAAEKMFGGVT